MMEHSTWTSQSPTFVHSLFSRKWEPLSAGNTAYKCTGTETFL
jgi:hypothetical protein